ncbi:MAG: M15 family metallopeptidase [Flavobacteriaceae bacterium]|nr:M15 family metallopeptidase [Flavobacteriaceae bacterium]
MSNSIFKMLTIKTFFLVCFSFFTATCNDVPQQIKYSESQLIGKEHPQLYGEGFKLQKEAYNAFIKMQKAALKEGIKIKVISSFRSYDHQNSIWKSKYVRYTKKDLTPQQAIAKIIEYSTIPGTSRHHWATDIDIVDGAVKAPSEDVLQTQFFKEGQVYNKLKKWLDKNANTYGFYLVYTNNPIRKGFNYEPWHYSYAPLSKPMLRAYLKLDLIKILRKNKLLGSDYFTNEFISRYKNEHVLGIANYLKTFSNKED